MLHRLPRSTTVINVVFLLALTSLLSPWAAALPPCGPVVAVPTTIWPPDHTFRAVQLSAVGVSRLTPYCVMQDEPLDALGDGHTALDAILAADLLSLRAEREGGGDGRVYRVYFTGLENGRQCAGQTQITVPQASKREAIDGGPLFNAAGGGDCRAFPNAAPVLQSTAVGNAYALSPWQHALSVQDAEGDTFTVSLVQGPAGLTLSSNASGGVFSWTPTLAQVGSHAVTLELLDAQGAAVTVTLTVTVLPPLNQPPQAVDSTVATTEDTSRAVLLSAQDPDGDTLDYLVVSAPLHGTLTGTAPHLVYTPDADYAGADAFRFRVMDIYGETAEATVALNVIAVNDAPRFLPVTVPGASEGTGWSMTLAATDAEGDALAFTLVEGPAGLVLDGQTLAWTPDYTQSGTWTIRVRVGDASGADTGQELTVVVANSNRAPRVGSEPALQVVAGSTWSYQPQAMDDDGDAVSLELVTAPPGMTFALVTGALAWTPTLADVGSHRVELRATDVHDASDTQRFMLTVELPPNHAPRITVTEVPPRVTEGTMYTLQVTAEDPDGDALFFSLASLPDPLQPAVPAGADIGLMSGVLTWTPTAAQVGEHRFLVRATDTRGASVDLLVVVTVRANLPPVWISAPLTTWHSATGYRYPLTAVDPEAQAIAFSLLQGPPGMSLADGVLAWEPGYTHNGTHDITVLARDAAGKESQQSFRLDLAVRAAPQFTSEAPWLGREGDPLLYSPRAVDPNGDAVTLSLVAAPAGAALVAGELQWTPDAAYAWPRRERLPACRVTRPPVDDFVFRPVLKQRLDFGTMVSSPLVAQLTDDNGDGLTDGQDDPDIVYYASYAVPGASSLTPGGVTLVDAQTGHVHGVIRHPQHHGQAWAHVAVADVDEDGRNDVLMPLSSQGVAAFRADGTLIWSATQATTGLINADTEDVIVHAQDLDHDGHVEIIAGRLVLNHDGSVRARLPAGNTAQVQDATLSLADDLDGDGNAEIILGASVYDHLGNLRWRNTAFPQMYMVPADVDGDGRKELFGVNSSARVLFDDNGTILWQHTVSQTAGIPSAGDLDGDGRIEFVYAGRDNAQERIYAFDATGSLLWQVSVEDDSVSGHSGVALFDFNGDGVLEVVHGDAATVRVLDGVTGHLRWSMPQQNPTRNEGPVIADLDGDGSAELLVAGNRVAVYAAADNNWMPAARVWPGYTITDWTPWLGHDTVPAGTRVAGFADGNTPLPDVGLTGATLIAADQLRVAVASRGEVASLGQWRIDVSAHGMLLGSMPLTTGLPPGASASVDIALPALPPEATDLTVELVPLAGTPDCLDSDNRVTLPRFVLRAVDADGDSSEQAFVVNVQGSHVAPAISGVDAAREPAVDRLYVARILATDPDAGDALQYRLEQAPAGMRALPSGQLVWRPQPEQAGLTHVVQVVASDLSGSEARYQYSVTVSDTPATPVFVTVPTQQVHAGSDFRYQAQATDANRDDVVNYRLRQGPRGMTVDSRTGEVRWPAAEMTPYLQSQEIHDDQCAGVDLVPLDAAVAAAIDPNTGLMAWHIEWSGLNRGLGSYAGWVSYTATWASGQSTVANGFTGIGIRQSFEYDYYLSDTQVVTVPVDYSVKLSRKDGLAECNTVNNTMKVPFAIIEAVDSTGQVALQPFFVNVEQNSNTSPSIVSTPAQYVLKGATWTYTLETREVDPLDTLYYAVSSPGIAITRTGNVLSVTPTTAGHYTVAVTVRDAGGLSAAQNFPLHVIDPVVTGNAPPVITSTPTGTPTIGQPFTYTLVASDPEGGALTSDWPELPAGAQFTPTATGGQLSWTPTAAGTYRLRTLVSDAGGLTAQQAFTLTVAATANTAPVITSMPPATRVTEGSAWSYALTATDAQGDALTWSLASAPAGATLGSTGQFTWPTTAGDAGAHVIEVRATDVRGAWALQRFTVNVNPPENRLPVVLNEPETTVSVGTDWSWKPTAMDPDGDTLTWRLIAGHPAMYWSAASRWFYLDDKQNTQPGRYDFLVGVTDGKDEVVLRYTLVVIDQPNTPPAISEVYFGTVVPNVALSKTLGVTDSESDTYTLVLESGPAGMSLAGKTLTWTPTGAQVGTHDFVLLATDARGAWTRYHSTITVSLGAANLHPVITSTPPDTLVAGQTLTYTLTAYDPNGTALTWSMPNAPAGAQFNAVTHTLAWPTTLADVGVHAITLRVSDGTLYADQLLEIPVNRPQPLELDLRLLDAAIYEGDTVELIAQALGGYGQVLTALYINELPVPLDAGYYAFVADTAGEYRVRAEAQDASGVIVTRELTFVVRLMGDLLPPAISFALPEDGGVITAPTDIVGTITDAHLLGYTVAIRPAGEGAWQTIASGQANVENGVLGRIDPTVLLNGQYEVRVRALDLGDNFVEYTSSFLVDGAMKIGQFAFSVEDLNVPFSGLPVRVSRSYDTRRRGENGDFGPGWILAVSNARLQENRVPGEGWDDTVSGYPFFTFCLYVTGKHRVTVTLPDDTVESFTLAMKPSCKLMLPPSEMEPVYTAEAGTTSTLEALQANGTPYTHLNYNGGRLYDGLTGQTFNPTLYRLTTRAGYVYLIEQGKGIRTVTDPNGNVVTYSASGISHSDGSRIAFSRNSQGRITAVTDPNGNVQRYGYDARGDLVTHSDALGNVTSYEYATGIFAHAMTEIRDPLNRPLVRNIFDDDGRLVAQEDNEGNRTEFDHWVDGRYSIVTDRNGHREILEYNERGDVVRKTDAENHVWAFTYDALGNLLTETDPLGRTTRRTLNAYGDVLSVTDSLGNTTAYTYNSRGHELTITDALGRTHANEYDVVGNLLKVTDPSGNVADALIGAKGLPEAARDLLGNRTVYRYDGEGRKTEERNALGHVTTWTYDANGNALTETKQRTVDGTPVSETTAFTYDARDRVVSTTTADGAVTRSEYDIAGNETAQIDALGHRTEMAYDAYGRPTGTRYPDGSTTSKSYDAEGNLVSETDRNGQVTTFTYDGNDRLVRTTYPDGTYTETEYDAAGQVIAERDARGHVTTHAYDAAGRRTHTTDALGGVTAFAYDANGNLVEQTDPNGNTTRYEYNLLDQRVKTLLPDGTTLQDTFDAEDRRLTSRDPVGLVTTYRYDALGRLTQVLDAAGFGTAFGYDEHGNKVSQTDAEGRVSTFAHDALGREVTNTLPLGQQAFTTYDAAGNVATQADYNGATTTFTYDANGRTTRIDYADGTVESFTYDANGNRLTATQSGGAGAQGTTSYQYDERNRLVREDKPDGSALTYAYDANGNRTRVTASGHGKSATTRYTYDALNRLATVTDEQGGVTTHTWDAAGNLETLAFPNGLVTTYTYDTLNRPLSVITRNAQGAIVGSETYTLHLTGRRTQVQSFDGNTTTTQQYRYDLLYRLFEETTLDPSNVVLQSATYTYDRVGNRVYAIEDGVHTQYSYDANDRLLGAGGVSYAYDNAGNLLSETQDGQTKTYTWDAKQKLAQASTPSGLVDYLYDTDGIRSAKLVNGQRTDYVVDHNTAYAQVLLEADPSGTAAYTRGLALLGQERDGATRYYHADALGSTKQLSDATGTTTDRYAYTAFGKAQSATGSTPNSYRYTGEQFDDSLGQYYLRARNYDPVSGRFTQRDPFEGANENPVTLHDYIYAGNDPSLALDRSGRMTIIESMASVSITASITYAISAGLHEYMKLFGGRNTEINLGNPLKNPLVAIMLTGFAGPAIANDSASETRVLRTIETQEYRNPQQHHTIPVYMCGYDRDQWKATVSQEDHYGIHADIQAHAWRMEAAYLELLTGKMYQFVGNRYFSYNQNNLSVIKELAQDVYGRSAIVSELGHVYVRGGWFGRYPNMRAVFSVEAPQYEQNKYISPESKCRRDSQ